jgi:hypothetical protein
VVSKILAMGKVNVTATLEVVFAILVGVEVAIVVVPPLKVSVLMVVLCNVQPALVTVHPTGKVTCANDTSANFLVATRMAVTAV